MNTLFHTFLDHWDCIAYTMYDFGDIKHHYIRILNYFD